MADDDRQLRNSIIAPLRGLRGRIGNPLEWPALDRTLVLLGASSLGVGVAGVGLTRIPSSQLAPFVDPEILRLTLHLHIAVVAIWLSLLAVGLVVRPRRPHVQLVGQAFLHTWAVYFGLLVYLLGMYQTTLWVVAGAMVLPVVMIDRKGSNRAVITGGFVLISLGLSERAGLIPYAPLFSVAPYDGDGRPVAAWAETMALVALAAFLPVWWVSNLLMSRLEEQEKRLRDMSYTDALTGLPNRRYFSAALARECDRVGRGGTGLALLMCDIDHFKKVNDTHGHDAGDDVLQLLGLTLRGSFRHGVDVAARLGGEEFIILLPDSDLIEGEHAAGRLMDSVRALRIPVGGEQLAVTVSVGVTSLDKGQEATPKHLLRMADECLYEAKESGRDRMASAPLPTEEGQGE